jgi:hypothetical protein
MSTNAGGMKESKTVLVYGGIKLHNFLRLKNHAIVYKKSTYSIGLVFSDSRNEGMCRIWQLRKFLGIQWYSLADKASAGEWEILLVRFGQFALLLQSFVESLTDCAVSTIGTDENIALVDNFIWSLDPDLVVFLGNGKDSLAKEDLVGWYPAQEQVVQEWSWDNVTWVSRPK